MRLGAVFPQGEFTRVDGDEVASFAQRVEEAGYDHLLVYDHVLGADVSVRPDWKGFYTLRDPFLEPFMLFSYLARCCSLEFVTDVLVLPQRQTALVAKQAATLANLAPGRLRLGIGIGWNAVEYESLGIDFQTRATRVEEQIPLLRRLWTELSVSHLGSQDVVDAAGIAPLPPGQIPIWIGSSSDPRVLRRVGRLADGWIPMPPIEPGHGFEEAWSQIRTSALDAGRDPDTIGLEPHVRVQVDDLGHVRDDVARWSDVGADAIAVNPLRADARWPDGHLDALVRAADLLR